MNKGSIGNLEWDSSTFPIVCEKCLGNDPLLRMIKNNYQNECKICKRPFTVFTWKANSNSRYKKTEICPTCAKLKNVCQVCLFDLQFGLPVAIRDKYLKKKIDVPKERANLNFFISKATENFDGLDLPYYKENAYKVPISTDLINNEKNDNDNNKDKKVFQRNKPHICSFFLRGECNRGEYCPYRHEYPDIELEEEENIEEENVNEKKKNIEKNIISRYNGIDDPVARKIISKYNNKIPQEPPKDKSIKTLIISDVIDESIKEKEVINIFSPYGKLKGVKLMINNGNCIFVTFNERKDCEKCISELFNKLYINNEKYRLTWAKINDSSLYKNDKKNNNNESDQEKSEKEDENKIEYKVECPKYDENINKNIAIKKEEQDKKLITIINLTSYDNGEIPYYASIDPKNFGGVANKKRKRYIEDL